MTKRPTRAELERLLTEVVDALADIGAGDLDRRLDLGAGGDGEERSPLGEKLAGAFDAAVARLRGDVRPVPAREHYLLRTLVDNLPILIYAKDTESRFTLSNASHLRALGVDGPEDALGRCDFDFFPPELADGYYTDEQAIFQTGRPLLNREEQVTDQTTGETSWISTTKVPVRNDAGEIVGLVGFGVDITEQKQTQEALRNLDEVIQHSPAVAFIWPHGEDDRWAVEYVSGNVEQFGYCPEAFYDGLIDYGDIIHPDDRERVEQGAQQHIEAGLDIYEQQYRILTAAGEVRWVIDYTRVERDADGVVIGYRGLVVDITNQRRVEEALRRSEARYQTLFDSAADAILIYDRAGKFLEVNLVACERLGYSRAEMFQLALQDISVPEFAAHAEESIAQVFERGRHVFETAHVRRDGSTIPVEVNSQVIDYNGQEAVLMIARDITQRRQSEQLLRLVMDNIPQAVYWKDRNLVYLGANRRFARDAGFESPDRVIGKTAHAMPWAEHADQHEAGDRAVMESDAPRFRIERVDQAGRWLSESKIPLHDADGHVIGVLGTYEDITERRQSEQRLRELSQALQKRNAQLRTASEVSAAASEILDLDFLQQRVVNLVRERFNLYYVGLFLIDRAGEWTGEPGRWAVLRAGTGEAGRKMLNAGHKLEIGGASMIGECIARAKAQIALDVGAQARRFDNPLLPETRSEMALPLATRGERVGALTIQSTQEAAFSEEDVNILQTLANQLANVIENARLFEQTQAALAEVREAEHAFVEERNLLRTVIDTLPDHIYAKDTESRFIINNAAHLAAMGMAAQEDALGKTDFDIFPVEQAEQYYADERNIIESLKPVIDKEVDARYPSGKVTWASVTKVPLLDGEGNVVGIVGVSRDVTAQKQAAQERERLAAEAQRNLALFRSVVDATPDWIFIKDRDFRYVLANRGYAGALHLAPEDVVGKDDLELGFSKEQVFGDPEQGIRGYRADDAAVLEGRRIANPADPTLLDGEMRIFDTIKLPLRDADGQVWGVLGFVREVTERERLLATIGQRNAQLQTASEVSGAASSILDLDDLQQRVVDLICERFDLYYVGLFLVDLDGRWTGEPWTWAVLRAGTGEAGRAMLARGHRLEIGGASMIGQAIAFAEAQVALDVGAEAHRFDNPLLPDTRSELALPLVSRGQVTGALSIQSTREAAFSAEDITVLQTLGNQVANAVENARLFEEIQQRARRRNTQLEAGVALNRAVDPGAIFQAAAEYAARLLDVPEAHVFAHDQVDDALVWRAGCGAFAERLADSRTPLEQTPFARRVLSTQKPIIQAEVPQDDPAYATVRAQGVTAFVLLPLVAGSKSEGVLFVEETRGPRRFSNEDVDAVTGLVNQAAIVLENRNLIEQTQDALDETEALYQAIAQLNAVDTYDEVIELLQTYTILGRADLNISVNLYNRPWIDDDVPEWSTPVARWSRMAAGAAQDRYPLRAFPAARLLKPDEPLVISDVANDPRLDERTRALYRDRFGAAATVFLPMVVTGQWIGYINAIYARPTAFAEIDLRRLMSLVGQAAVAITSIRRLEQVRESLAEAEALYAAGQAMGRAEDEHGLLMATARYAIDRGAASASLLYLDTDAEGRLEEAWVVATWLAEDTGPAFIEPGACYDAADLPLADVWRENPDQPYLFGDAQQDERIDAATRQRLAELGQHAVIVLPLTAGRRWVGLLHLHWTAPQAFEGRDERIYASLRDQVSVAVDNRRLLARMQAVIEDIQEAQTALADERNLLRTMIDNLPDNVYVKDCEGRFLLYNLPTMRSLGVDDFEAALGKTDFDFFPEDLSRQYREDERRVIEDGEALLDIEERTFNMTTGTEIWFSTSKIPLRDQMGNIIGLVGMGRDITAQKEAAVERERLIETTQQALMEAETLYEASRKITGGSDIKAMFDGLVEYGEQHDADRMALGLWQADADGTEYIEIADYWDRTAGENDRPGEAFGRDHPYLVYLGRLFGVNGAPALVVKDLDNPPPAARMASRIAEAIRAGFDARSFAVFPITIGAERIGVLVVMYCEPRAMAPEEHRAYQSLSGQAAVVIRNQRLVEQTWSALEEALRQYEAARRITDATDLAEMLLAICHFTAGLVHASMIVLFDYDPDTGSIESAHTPVAVSGDEAKRLDLKQPLYGDPLAPLYQEVLKGEPVVVENVEASDLFDLDGVAFFVERGIRAMVNLPMEIGGRVLGFVMLGVSRPHVFSPTQVRALSTLAGQMAVTYQNQQLFDQTQAALQESRALFDTGQAVLRAVSPVDLATAVLAHAFPHLDGALISRYERDPVGAITGMRVLARLSSHDIDAIDRVMPVLAVMRPVIDDRQPVSVSDVADHPLILARDADALRRQGIAAFAAFPMVARREDQGMLIISHTTPYAFDARETRIGQTVAGQIVTRLENQELLAQTQRQTSRLALLNRLSQLLSASLEMREIIQVVSREVTALLDVDRASLCLPNPDGQTLRIVALEGSRIELDAGQPVPVAGSVVGQVFISGEPSITDDVTDSVRLDEQALARQGLRASLVVPLIAGGQTLGTINVASRQERAFSEDDRALMAQAARQVAVAMENARLFTEVRDRAERERTVSRVSTQLTERTDVETMLETTLRELGVALGAKRARVRMRLGQRSANGGEEQS
ncbi:MAG: PAS domain-containing protein [Anaerolineae bacterium]|nr:PAS domain-containing protein [Anaerolineae bacterium]